MSNLVVIISVDWEGRSLLAENLAAMKVFRGKYPDIPFQHFLNPAYYTRRGVEAGRVSDAIRSVSLPEDENGLHVHAWHSLVSAADVTCRSEPRFIEEETAVPMAQDDWGFYPAEDGYDVPLEAYTAHEVGKILAVSNAILASAGFSPARTFRAGGWMSGPNVQEALAANGFIADCSAVDPHLAISRFGDMPLCRWLSALWPEIGRLSQPSLTTTAAGPLWQVPNNAGLADYASVEALMEMFCANLEATRTDIGSHRLFSTGFHQETARLFLDRLDDSIPLMRAAAARAAIRLIFASRPQDYLCTLPV